MKASDLKYHVGNTGSNFFCWCSMKFLGDTMKNYGVRENYLETYSGDVIPVYELFRRSPVKGGVISSAYFNRETFKREFKK